MTWHLNDATDTCKSVAMWSLFPPENTPSPEHNSEGFFSEISITLSRSMEEDLRLSSPPLASDPEPLAESIRSSSGSSVVTVANTDADFSHHCAAAPFMEQPTVWTDQKHSLYIRSLEASFLNELHLSMRLRGWSVQNNTDEPYKCRTLQNSFTMPMQSLALQDCCQKKISLERIAPMLESTADSHVLAGSQFGVTSVDRDCTLREPNTYDHVLLCDEEIHARGSLAVTDRSPRSLEKLCSCHSSHLEPVGSTTEVTDQNFMDEEARSSCMPMMKRLKTDTGDGSSSDQVVPFGNFHTPYVSTGSNSTSENIGHELQSEPPRELPFSKL